MDREHWIRLIAYIPLLTITLQVVWLSRILTTRAWVLLAMGFTAFAFLAGLAFFVLLPISVRLGGAFLGYALISLGFHIFRRDLIRVLSPSTKKGQ